MNDVIPLHSFISIYIFQFHVNPFHSVYKSKANKYKEHKVYK